MNHPNNKKYLIRLQYLGFRFHGWQFQPDVKTVQQMVDKTLQLLNPENKVKTLGSGRTDRMVSANDFALVFTSEVEFSDQEIFDWLNLNLPPDIRPLSVKSVDESFRVINDVKSKEYVYMFAHGERSHPFCASLMTTFLDDLDIDKMKEAALLFQGEHNFKKFCYKPKEDKEFTRNLEISEIVENTLYTANFFPEKTYLLRVKGSGFMRHQIRMMMGFLVDIGLGVESIETLKNALNGNNTDQHNSIAPQSGLIVQSINY